MGHVIVDTSVWSLALRRRRKSLSPPQRALDFLLRELIVAGDALLLGAVRQEVLTGIAEQPVFERLAAYLRDFEDVLPDSVDYERAAAFANICQRRGVAHSPIDMLLCAVAVDKDLPILSEDNDFDHYATCLPIRLYPRPT